jgi:hypothetical protein
MARKAILETGYAFTPSTKTVVIPRAIQRERLILITNVTTNQVIYNFSDANLKAITYTVSGSEDTTTVVLNYDTTGMSSTDKLQIIIDEYDEKITPSETFMDPVGKMRVSTPQALIDTDFEYGTQPSKWETLTLLNNKPSAFYDSGAPVTSVTNITGNGTRTVTVNLTSTAGITVGTPVFIQDTEDPLANGWQLVETVVTNSNFTYVARANVFNGQIFDSSKTYVFIGSFYTGAQVTVSSTAGAAFTNVSTLVTCTTTNNHGLSIGDGILVRNTTATTNPPNGAFFVKTVPTSNTFTFDVDLAPTGTITATGGTQNLYVRPYSASIHRPFDGGVSFSAGTPYHGNQLIRQTRRYFRYQSGKGIQFSTGTNLKPALQVDSITSSGTTVTVRTKFPHNFGPGATVSVSGADQSAYNGTFTVATVPSDLTFTYTALSTPSATPATGFPISVSPSTWYGSKVRIGMFDEQNGFFFEYDGQRLYAVRRSSTDQLSGGVSVTNGSPVITGNASGNFQTYFSSQLKPGDYITIRGMSYLVLSITSDTQMIVSPEYRGTTITSGAVIVTKRSQQRIPQSSWNIDKCDGTGPSGFNLDLTKMQMLYIDYSWYGAGAIRFGFKNQRGEIIYAHRIPNANLRTEAYMRSGNLPSRYECNTIPPITYLTSTLANAATSMSVNDTSEFPSTGTLVVRAAGNTGATVEYINYTGKTATSFTGLTRAVTNLTGPGGLTGGGGTATAGGGTFTFSATAPISVEMHSPQHSASVGHWGSSVVMDGRYDDDKSFLFTAGMITSLSVNAAATNALLSIRLAPSVDSGLTGLLGSRELINRMQLTLREVGVLSGGNFLISLILNGRVSGGSYTAAGGSSLAQVCRHTVGQTVTGGETVYSFFTDTRVTSRELDLVRDLGNSVLGGGNTLNAPTTVNNIYPDGPDIIVVAATNVGTAATTINARISWTEAQA